jgi:hypothetical protein
LVDGEADTGEDWEGVGGVGREWSEWEGGIGANHGGRRMCVWRFHGWYCGMVMCLGRSNLCLYMRLIPSSIPLGVLQRLGKMDTWLLV